ncbi:unnamed protein product [Brassica rapa]|uniref:Uncharacterized protein n=1 Tax=Brassica campestris TaxID=3711 RepID=A0A8D9HM44_BRACM|nr:unnamed protein product [Brassica rapa]CAG7902072.1 unnamed protein product [Brassica rapa]
MVAAMKTTLSTKTTNIIPANFFTLLADLKASLCLRSDWFRSNGLASYSAQLFSFGSIQLPDLDFYFDNSLKPFICCDCFSFPFDFIVLFFLIVPVRLSRKEHPKNKFVVVKIMQGNNSLSVCLTEKLAHCTTRHWNRLVWI